MNILALPRAAESVTPWADPLTPHLILCGSFGKLEIHTAEQGRCWTFSDVVKAIRTGEAEQPQEVWCFTIGELVGRNVSEDVARAVLTDCVNEGHSMSEGARNFIHQHLGQVVS